MSRVAVCICIPDVVFIAWKGGIELTCLTATLQVCNVTFSYQFSSRERNCKPIGTCKSMTFVFISLHYTSVCTKINHRTYTWGFGFFTSRYIPPPCCCAVIGRPCEYAVSETDRERMRVWGGTMNVVWYVRKFRKKSGEKEEGKREREGYTCRWRHKVIKQHPERGQHGGLEHLLVPHAEKKGYSGIPGEYSCLFLCEKNDHHKSEGACVWGGAEEERKGQRNRQEKEEAKAFSVNREE